MKTALKVLGALLLAGLVYLVAWPVPIEPISWAAPQAPGYVGPHAPNSRLAHLQTLGIGQQEGPEHIAVGLDGKLYAALASGDILRMNLDGTSPGRFANTGGRVLGFDFDASGNLIAADALRGLLQITPAGVVTVLADRVSTDGQNDPIRFADAVVVARNGQIYFTDASQRFGPREWDGTFEASVLDIPEQSATGRVLVYDPATGRTRVLAQGLSFANGVALSADERHLFVNETGKYRVWKIAVSADKLDIAKLPPAPGGNAGAAAAVLLLDNLPGYPDNLMRGLPTADGSAKIWLGFAKPRSAAIDKMAGTPFLRKLTLRLPRALWPIPPRYGHVIAFTEDGKVVADLQDPTGSYPETTGVTETADRLYIQSLHAHSIGWLKK